MAFVGNRNGPAQSEIIWRLGAEYFGCSPEALDEDISFHINSEARGEVVPVNVDESGQPYLIFRSPGPNKLQRFYLEAGGYPLRGDIQTYTEEEKEFWIRRISSN
jgi:hypothetical protein